MNFLQVPVFPRTTRASGSVPSPPIAGRHAQTWGWSHSSWDAGGPRIWPIAETSEAENTRLMSDDAVMPQIGRRTGTARVRAEYVARGIRPGRTGRAGRAADRADRRPARRSLIGSAQDPSTVKPTSSGRRSSSQVARFHDPRGSDASGPTDPLWS